jgi:subtilisin family serine protease
MDDGPAGHVPGTPAVAPLRRIRGRYDAVKSHFDAWRLGEAADGLLVPESRIYDYVSPATVGGLKCTKYSCDGVLEPHYEASSHGLFVADIVNDLAPEAEISIYRVLNNDNGGDMATVAAAVEDAVREARRRGLRLVINASLGIAPPLEIMEQVLADDECFYGRFGSLQAAIQSSIPPMRNAAADVAALKTSGIVNGAGDGFAGIVSAIEHVFSFRNVGDVLVVAATGNDSCSDSRRAAPRMPAAVPGVLGTAAFIPNPGGHGRWRMAPYSNDDELLPGNDGIGAFGGAVIERTGDTDTADAMVGLYVSDTFPDADQTPNDTGLAAWAGTSFAAPIAAGFAACVWSSDTSLTGHQVRQAIAYDRGGRPRGHLPFLQR